MQLYALINNSKTKEMSKILYIFMKPCSLSNNNHIVYQLYQYHHAPRTVL